MLAVVLRRDACGVAMMAGTDAAEPDEHRHETAPGKAQLAEELVHDEGNPGHVARVLEQ